MKKNLIYALAIFPVLALAGLAASLLSGGRINALFWAIFPSILFEQGLESWNRALSDSLLLNGAFVFLFWAALSLTTGLLAQTLIRRLHVR